MSTPETPRHTPGPWAAVLPGDPRGQPQAIYRGLIALVSTDPAISVKSVSLVTAGPQETSWAHEWEANAKLMAAAPEMLDALKLAEDWLVSVGADGSPLSKIRDAIRKAGGR